MNGTVQSAANTKLSVINIFQLSCAIMHAHMHLTLSDSSFNGLSKDGEVTLVLTLMIVVL